MESAGDQEIGPEKNNSSGDDDQQIPPAAAKSYECTFCKRGFSNAQALGGHMNIHRKDKAKLKQVSSSSSNRLPNNLEIIPKITSYSPILPKTNSLDAIHGDHHIERSTIAAMRAKRAASGPPAPSWFFSDKEGDDDQFNQIVQQLPLFSQTPSNQEHQNRGGQREQEQVHEDQGDENDLDLDLELRLGPEPVQDSSSTPPAKGATTRKFF